MGFIKWHKELIDRFMNRWGIDWYANAWIAWFKGLIIGLIMYHFLLI